MSDAVERLVRELIRENQLSRARDVLSIFQEDYPHLLLELEAASGNWIAVLKLYERLSDEKKEEYKTLYKTAQERVREDYREDIKDSLEEIDRTNFEGAMAILESVSKAYPELVEAIALKLELARKKGDKAREKVFEELLKKLDSSHPSLSKKAETARRSPVDLITLILVCATLAVSFIGLMLSGVDRVSIGSVVEEKITPLSEKIDKLSVTSNTLTAKTANIESELQGVMRSQNELSQEFSELRLSVNSAITMIQSSEQRNVESMDEIKQTLKRIEQVLNSVGKASEKVEYTLRGKFDIETARSIWLFGYNLYRRGYYLDAAEILRNLLDQLSDDVYFKDDVHYYMALSYYSAGNSDEAKKSFESFLEKYPESVYVVHARNFLNRIE
ncbi:MAG: tetratricopeptide repeat protein [Pseudothermotoga sp.]|uniref:tetratricopeptide repeat protein n=1 Tax=Pseudothermotoga sp. TaxID=2033661 RepID=UPI00258643AA|nr:tetratricopeptide repeat protein [Pseudothermotoga sp.]MDI6862295.1 tetratricopeptide repeat protein [Pseudothermotoga sp.]